MGIETGTVEPSGGWALVDVETTGLSACAHRVVSVACRTVDADGRVSSEWSSLVDPGCDPGPVHIHGITRERLRGAPTFADVVEDLRGMVDGRVLVAHNAKFDHGFLSAEYRRNGHQLPVARRLCTVTASRRLDLPVENYRLDSLARFWGIRQVRWHDALDDVRVLSEIFSHTRTHAARLGVDLPVLACGEDDRGAASTYPTHAPRIRCPYVNPPSWRPGEALVQGTKIVITGETRSPRADWHDLLVARGLYPMNSVSGQTRLVVCNDSAWASGKLTRARELGVPVVTETELRRLVQDVQPGVSHEDAAAAKADAARQVRRTAAPTPRGAWTGRVVLVLGGTHDQAAQVRERVAGEGARVLISLGTTATHVVALDGAQEDRRWDKVVARGLQVVGPNLVDVVATTSALDLGEGAVGPVDPVGRVAAVPAGPAGAVGQVLVRGQTVDLPDPDRLTVGASWSPGGPVVDLVAFALDANGRVGSDTDFVFYNQPSRAGIALDVDGDAEQGIDIDLDALADEVSCVRVVAVVDGSGTFGDVGAVAVEIDTEEGRFASAVLDAASVETALVLAEVYRREGTWRVRVVGRGYEQSLGEVAAALGVEVD